MGKIIIDAPRVNEFKPDVINKSPFAVNKKRIKSVSLQIVNFDEEYEKDCDKGTGFLITNEKDYDEKTDARTEDGLYSPKFGASTFSDPITEDFYRCECGETTGSLNEGCKCPKCKTLVQFVDSDLDIFGYIPLGDYTVINPAIYSLLAKLMGEKDLQSIIKFNNKFDVSGKNISTKTKSSPYQGIGIGAFKKHFDEIIDFYADKKKQSETYQVIKRFEDCAFTHYIPVYSALLRPLVKDDSRISMVDDNKSYKIILSNSIVLRKSSVPGVDKTIINEGCLFEVQTKFLQIYHSIIDQCLSSKKGVIRGQVTCNRVDYSARCVIVPGCGLAINEVEMPYVIGLELMRPLIVNKLSTTLDISAREANSRIDAALRQFDKAIWFLMNSIVKDSKNPPLVIVQRSPSLLQESMRLMHVKDIKADINDFTLDVPVGILDRMNADFDGDTFSVIMIYDNRLKESWEPLHSPVYQMISRHDGLYSSGAEFIKDTAITLNELWNMGKNKTYYEYQATESERAAFYKNNK